jgi:putative peptide zinc metalloprotease protein
MSATLLSPNWYRVASLKPRLRAGVRIMRHRVRGESWVVITDPVSGQHHRFDRHAWALLAGCDGQRTLDDVWAARAEAEVAATQEQTLAIVSQAFAANLLLGDVPPEAKAVLRAHRRDRARRRRGAINPLAFRVRLWNPDVFLGRCVAAWPALFAALYGRAALVGLALLLLGALAQAAVHGAGFAVHTAALVQSPRFWLVTWLIFPLLKGLHELAHAFAVKHFGGEVHGIGVTLMLLTPVPFVDASAAVAFPDKRKRAAVAAAGVGTELALAALAFFAWVLLEPGWVRDLAASVVVLGGASTLLVNGNPLLRFDGYHVATDLLELPNLASRSSLWWRLTLRRSLGARHAVMQHLARGERGWLVAYAPLSLAMQALLLGLAVAALAQWNGYIAAALALVALATLVLWPLLRALGWVLHAAELNGTRAQALLAALLGVALALGLLTAVPFAHRTHAPGIVWLPDDAFVRSASEGFVVAYHAADGSVVEAGAPLVTLVNDTLHARWRVVGAQLRSEQVDQAQRFATDALGSAQAADRVARLQAEHADLAARIEALQLRATRRGRLVLDPQKSRIGQFVPQGELIAQVLPLAAADAAAGARALAAPIVRAFVSNDDIARFDHGWAPGRPELDPGRAERMNVRVSLAHGGPDWPARLLPRRSAASRELPSAALGEGNGGTITLDTADPQGRTAAQPRLALELQLPPEAPVAIGARVLVTFEHGSSSLVDLAAGALRRLFLRQFDQ